MADPGDSKQGAEGRLERAQPPGYFEGESMTRRNALIVGGQALGGLAGAMIALPAIGFAVAPLFEEEGDHWQAIGVPEDFSRDTYRSVVITAVEGIGEAGKTTAYVRRGNPDLEGENSELPRESERDFIAISTRCAHLGCPVRFVEAARNFLCPCHGGVYNILGEVIGGPPVRPLDRFQTELRDDGQVYIGPRYSVTSQLEPVRARDPGEFTGGIWEYLYPPRPSVPPAP